MNYLWQKFTSHFPPPVAAVLAAVFSVLAGLLLAVVVHYACYRIGLPSKPFIYVAF